MRESLKNKLSLCSWLFYDFANSAYFAVVVAVVFPVYLVKHLASSPVVGDVWWGRAVAISMLAVAVTAPFIGGIADLSGYRKRFLTLYTLVGIVATAGLGLSDRFGFWWALGLFVIANFAVETAVVFYNAFLPEVSDRDHLGRVSGWGFGLGYVGSTVGLLVSLFLVQRGHYAEAFIFVAAFFLIFALPGFFFLKEPISRMDIRQAAIQGWTTTVRTLKTGLANRGFRLFLFSYFCFRDGINTIIAFSSIFAANTLGFSHVKLLWLYLLIQMTAMVGALIMAWPTDYWGPKRVLFLSLFVWAVLCVWAYFVGPEGFWYLAALGGVFLGATQSAARAMFTGFIPRGAEAEYFGLYGFVGKTSSVLGPLIFSMTVSFTNSERLAALSVGLLFLLGILFLVPVKMPEAYRLSIEE